MHTGIWQGAGTPASPLETPRLVLIDITRAMLLQSQSQGNGGLARASGLIVPASWPPEDWDQKAVQWVLDKMDEWPGSQGWGRYVTLRSPHPTLIGSCGCVGLPEATDDVEIGYAILPEYQRRGYATEAVSALLKWIFSFAHVRSINAQTFPHLAGSLGVLRRLGFVAAGDGAEPGAVRFRLIRP
jgi:RimJ/RimL family protein N-acetyltransferase